MVSTSVKKVVDFHQRETEPPTLPFGIDLSYDELVAIANLPTSCHSRLFPKGVDDYKLMSATVECPKCRESYHLKGLSKAKLYMLFRYVRNQKKYAPNLICEACQKDEERARRGAADKRRNDREHEIADWIEIYLDPDRSWGYGISIAYKWLLVSWVHSEEVEAAIQALSYEEFLSTPYWAAVSLKAKARAGFRCQLCNSGGNLQTHHRTYDHHGAEHLHMDDLIVLCADCHDHFHEKEC